MGHLYFVGNKAGHIFYHDADFIVVCHLFDEPTYVKCAPAKVDYKQQLEYSMMHQGMNEVHTVSINRWLQICIDFLLTNVLEPGKQDFTEWKLFPPLYRELTLSVTKKIAMLFYNTLSSLTTGGIIIIGYNSSLHFKFILATTSTDSNRDFRNRILIFHPDEGVLINIRATSSTNVDDVYAAWIDCSQDIKDILHINGSIIFKNSGIILLGVVAALHVDKNEIGTNFCIQCTPFVLTSTELHNQAALALWLQATLREKLKSIRKRNKISTSDNQTKSIFETFKELSSPIIGYMANILLHLSGPNDIHTAIQNIQLNNSQIQAYLSPKQHVIIKGSYGTGKSVIGQLHLERLAHEGGIIYYIIFDPFSGLEYCIRNTAKKLEEKENKELLHIRVANLATIAEEFGFSELPPLSKVISSIHNKHGDKPFQIIIDEFDGQTLDRYEAENIKEQLQLIPNSFVLIVAQAYENERVFKQKGKLDIKRKRFQYHATRMEVIELRKTMRTSVSIHNLLSVAVATINQTASEFFHPIFTENKAVLKKTTSKENTFLRVKRLFKQKNPAKETTSSSTYDDSYPTQSSSSLLPEEQDESKLASHKDDAFPKNKVEMDTIFTLLSQSNLQCSSEKTITWSKYMKNDGCGHNYVGPKPFLIYPPKKNKLIKRLIEMRYSKISDEHLNILRLLICFNSCITSLPKVIVCNYVKEFYLFANILSILKIPYNDCAYDFEESKPKEHISCTTKHIITSRRSFRGMEAPSILLPVYYHDEFGRQYAVENIARTTVELSMIVLDENFKSSKGSIFGKVIDTWKSDDLVELKKFSCSCVNNEKLTEWMNTLQGMELQQPIINDEIELVKRYFNFIYIYIYSTYLKGINFCEH